MAQIRGTAGYNLGLQNQFGGPSRGDATSDPSPLDAIREQTSKIEDWLNSAGEPIKPCVSQLPGAFPLPSLFCDAKLEPLTDLLLFLLVPQVLTRHRTVFDRGDLPRRRAPNPDTVERSTAVSARLQAQYG
jgi:hypothetical protein